MHNQTLGLELKRGRGEKGSGEAKKSITQWKQQMANRTCDGKGRKKLTRAQSVCGGRFGTLLPPSESVPCHFSSPLSTLNTRPPLFRRLSLAEKEQQWRGGGISESPAKSLRQLLAPLLGQRSSVAPLVPAASRRRNGSAVRVTTKSVGRTVKRETTIHTCAHTCAQHGSCSSRDRGTEESSHLPDFPFSLFQSFLQVGVRKVPSRTVCAHTTQSFSRPSIRKRES